MFYTWVPEDFPTIPHLKHCCIAFNTYKVMWYLTLLQICSIYEKCFSSWKITKLGWCLHPCWYYQRSQSKYILCFDCSFSNSNITHYMDFDRTIWESNGEIREKRGITPNTRRIGNMASGSLLELPKSTAIIRHSLSVVSRPNSIFSFC